MPKRQELTDFERGEIIGLFKANKFSYKDIAEILDHPKSTVGDVIKKYNEEGLTTTKKRSGKPKKLTNRDERSLVKIIKENRGNTLEEVTEKFNTAMKISVSNRTVQRTLHKMGYSGHAAKKKPLVSEKNRKKRLGWCRMRRNWNSEWNKIVWSDESRFELFNNDSQNWVWRKKDEKYNVDCLKPTVKHSIGIMVWGCFCDNKLGPLVLVEGTLNSDKYIELLKNHLLPFLNHLNEEEELIPWYFFQEENYIFQDDNAPCHASAKTKSWKEHNSVEILPWPAQSPDLNPIENLWNILEKSIRKRIKKYDSTLTNKNNFFTALKEEWYKIEEDKLTQLVTSMPNRINAVIKSKGYPTKY